MTNRKQNSIFTILSHSNIYWPPNYNEGIMQKLQGNELNPSEASTRENSC